MRPLLNRWRRWLWRQLFYRMVFGEQGRAGQALPHTRIAPSTCIEGEAGLELADHVFIGQFNFLDATAGLRIAEGVQITNFVSIVTHSSHRSIRLLGRAYASRQGEVPGYVRAPVEITLPVAPGGITWDEGVRLVREATMMRRLYLDGVYRKFIAEPQAAGAKKLAA